MTLEPLLVTLLIAGRLLNNRPTLDFVVLFNLCLEIGLGCGAATFVH